MTARGAIDRLGRIGRATSRILREAPEFEFVTVNDFVPADNRNYLLRNETVKGRHPEQGRAKGGGLKVGDRLCRFRSDTGVAELNAIFDEEAARAAPRQNRSVNARS